MLVLFALTGCFFSSEPQLPTSGPAVYLLNEGDLPDGARLIEYQEVPHPRKVQTMLFHSECPMASRYTARFVIRSTRCV